MSSSLPFYENFSNQRLTFFSLSVSRYEKVKKTAEGTKLESEGMFPKVYYLYVLAVEMKVEFVSQSAEEEEAGAEEGCCRAGMKQRK